MVQLADIQAAQQAAGSTPNQRDIAALQQQTPQAGTRDLTMNPGNPLAFANTAAPTFGATATPDANTAFGTALTGLIQKYQTLGTQTTANTTNAQLNYSDAALKAANAQYTNPNLQGYAPSTIMNAGATAAKPFDTGLSGVQQQATTFQQQLSDFGNAINNTKSLLSDIVAQQDKQQQLAINQVHDLLTTLDPQSFKNLAPQDKQDLQKLLKTAGYPGNFLDNAMTYKQRQLDMENSKFRQQLNLQYMAAGIDPKTGKPFNYTPTLPGGGNVVDPLTDSQVARIIASNPGEYGHAADAIDSVFGPGTATKYDAQLKSVYQNKQDVNSVFGDQSANAMQYANPKVQNTLEQQYRQLLEKQYSARSGTLGIEQQKVNQANHLGMLARQYYNPKTGNFDIPQAQYAEFVVGLANLLSPNATATDSMRNEIMTRTVKGDIAGALTYLTGTPQTGTTQAVIRNLIDSVDRQGEQAMTNLNQAYTSMSQLAPTGLDPVRIARLNQTLFAKTPVNFTPISSATFNAGGGGNTNWQQTQSGLKYQILNPPTPVPGGPTSMNTNNSLGSLASAKVASPAITVNDLAYGIGQHESGGNYKAVNKTSGALGKYQVMPANLPQWSQKYLGKTYTPQQFLNDPRAQDKLFSARMADVARKYPNPQDQISIWFTGQPYAIGKNRSDINQSGARYVAAVMNHIKTLKSSRFGPYNST